MVIVFCAYHVETFCSSTLKGNPHFLSVSHWFIFIFMWYEKTFRYCFGVYGNSSYLFFGKWKIFSTETLSNKWNNWRLPATSCSIQCIWKSWNFPPSNFLHRAPSLQLSRPHRLELKWINFLTVVTPASTSNFFRSFHFMRSRAVFPRWLNWNDSHKTNTGKTAGRSVVWKKLFYSSNS